MTNEFAIALLKQDIQNSKINISYRHNEVGIKALELAIKALEQQPSEDCISREAVIKHICESKECYKDECKGRLYKRCFDLQWIYDLPSVTPQQTRWIPVSKELPEENIHVLCQFYMGGMAECYHAHGVWHIVGGYRISCDEVVAWMPLPETYKESEE